MAVMRVEVGVVMQNHGELSSGERVSLIYRRSVRAVRAKVPMDRFVHLRI